MDTAELAMSKTGLVHGRTYTHMIEIQKFLQKFLLSHRYGRARTTNLGRWMDGPTDRWTMDGQKDIWTEGRRHASMDGWMEALSKIKYRRSVQKFTSY